MAACNVAPSKSVNAALASLGWRKAMKEEYNALIRNGTWDLVPWSQDDNVIDFQGKAERRWNSRTNEGSTSGEWCVTSGGD